jgi:hypothetical protein
MFWPCQNANQFGLRDTTVQSAHRSFNNLPFDHTAIIPSQVLKYTARKPVLKNIFIISARTEQLHTRDPIWPNPLGPLAFCSLPMQKFISERIKISDGGGGWANSEGLCPIAGADAHIRTRPICMWAPPHIICSAQLSIWVVWCFHLLTRASCARGVRRAIYAIARLARSHTHAHNACVPHYDVIESLSNRAAEWINI